MQIVKQIEGAKGLNLKKESTDRIHYGPYQELVMQVGDVLKKISYLLAPCTCAVGGLGKNKVKQSRTPL